jgi:peptidyl-prolyl cis-trans isomerase D
MTPEVRAITALVLDRAAVASQLTVDEAELKAVYDERIDEFTVPERRQFAQVLLADEAAARQVADRRKEGMSLEAAARSVALGEQAVTRIGPVAEAQLPAELRAPVFAAKETGKVTDPVKSSLGWHVIDILAIEPGSVKPFAEVASQLREDMMREKAEERIVDLGNKIEDGLGRGQSLEAIAADVGLALRSIPAITAGGVDAAGNPVTPLPAKLTEAAFATGRGATSDLIESDGEYVLVRVDDVTPAAERDFALVESAVKEAWRAEARRQMAEETAGKIAERAASGTLVDAARDFGLTVAAAGPVDRSDGGDAALPTEVVRRALEGAAGQVATVPTAEAVYVLKTAEVPSVGPSAESSPAVRRELDEAAAALREDLLSQYLAALKTRYPVAINEAVVMQTPSTN